MTYDLIENYKRVADIDIHDQMYYVNIYITYFVEIAIAICHYKKQDEMKAIYEAFVEIDETLMKYGLDNTNNFKHVLLLMFDIVLYILFQTIGVLSTIFYLQSDAASKLLIASSIMIYICTSHLTTSVCVLFVLSYRIQILNNLLTKSKDNNPNICFICFEIKFRRKIEELCLKHTIR